MSWISVLFITTMLANLGLVYYSKQDRQSLWIILISIVGYFLAIFLNQLFLAKEYNIFVASIFFYSIQLFVFLKFFRFKWIFLIISLICYLRCFGFISLNPQKQSVDLTFILIISGAGGICFLWVICWFFIKKWWIQVLLIPLSACIVNAFIILMGYNHENILQWFYDFNAIFTNINIVIAFISYPLCLIFFCFGEPLLLFLLCRQIFLKSSQKSPIKDSNPQSHSPKDS